MTTAAARADREQDHDRHQVRERRDDLHRVEHRRDRAQEPVRPAGDDPERHADGEREDDGGEDEREGLHRRVPQAHGGEGQERREHPEPGAHAAEAERDEHAERDVPTQVRSWNSDASAETRSPSPVEIPFRIVKITLGFAEPCWSESQLWKLLRSAAATSTRAPTATGSRSATPRRRSPARRRPGPPGRTVAPPGAAGGNRDRRDAFAATATSSRRGGQPGG